MPDQDESQAPDVTFALPRDLAEWIAAAAKRASARPADVVAQAVRQLMRNDRDRNAVYLSAPVNALVEGLYEENTSIAEIKRHGDFGLGTFNQLDGEMVVLDGEVYQLRADGEVYSVDDAVETPFACVTFFHPDTEDEVDGEYDYDALSKLLLECIPSTNMLYAIRIDGEFGHVHTRSVPKQPNYRPLVEVAQEQPEFDYYNVTGTMLGFYTPSFMSSLNVPGLHLHFLSADRKHGGHLLSAQMRRATIAIQHVPKLEMGLPMTLDYLTADFTRDTDEDLDKAERES